MATPVTKLFQSFDSSPDAISEKKLLRRSGESLRLRQTLFVTTDLCCIVSGAILATLLRFPEVAGRFSHFAIAEHLGIAILYAALIVLFCHTQKLYTAYRPSAAPSVPAAIFKSILMATVLLGCTLFITGVKSTSRLIVACTAVYSGATMIGWRRFHRLSRHKSVADGLSCHNVLIIGTDDLARSVAEHLAIHRELELVVVGHLVANLPQNKAVAFDAAPLEILGSIDTLKSVCRTHFVDEVIVCEHDRATVMQVVAEARSLGVGVRVIPELYDGLATRMDYLGDFPSLAVVHRSLPAVAMAAKRIIDVVCSAAALLVLSPLLLLLAIIVKLDSRGPVFYGSKRVGKKGRVFSCLKFRTMVTDADVLKAKLQHLNERDGVLFKITKDPRITRAGRFLRKHSLDELMQLWNVLRGEMSLVGPRPPLVNEVKKYELDYLRRLEVTPGITGLWQVEARNDPSFDTYISLDLRYVENWSLYLDFQILLRTVKVVLAGTGS